MTNHKPNLMDEIHERPDLPSCDLGEVVKIRDLIRSSEPLELKPLQTEEPLWFQEFRETMRIITLMRKERLAGKRSMTSAALDIACREEEYKAKMEMMDKTLRAVLGARSGLEMRRLAGTCLNALEEEL